MKDNLSCHPIYSIKWFFLAIGTFLCACSNQALYHESARLQCEERYKYKPPGEAQVQCMNEKEIDGMTYEEYEQEREEVENSSGDY